MNINNIAIVRATNVIPFDGVVRPLSNVPYLCKNIGLEFSARISDLLQELGVIPPMDQSRMFEEDYYDKMVALSSKILKEYLPYVSDYNSMVLFSLNGICPDDNEHGFANNTFSNKSVGVIEPLLEHIDQAISLVPTDTAIKGDVVLSNNAIILIEESLYNSLSEIQKALLHNNTFTIKTFTGSLKDAIRNELQNSGRYIPETLSLSASTGGFMQSDTSEMQKECINNIANSYGLSQKKYFNLITSRDTSMPKYDEVCDEFDKAIKVQDYYITMFLSDFLMYVNAPEDMINNISKNIHYKPFLLKVITIIKELGIDKYKQFVDSYNKKLEEQQKNMTLTTPEDIISFDKEIKHKI